MHNLLAIAGRITFIFMNYGRQWIQDIFVFGIASVLLRHTEPSLLLDVSLAVFLLPVSILTIKFSTITIRVHPHIQVPILSETKLLL